MTIGQVIKNKRLEAGHSQEYLAEQLGFSRQTLSNWEMHVPFQRQIT
ncbi:helix-turn-helix domain-containing protein [Streptococcus cuniculi]|uniref:XRE family transcriptional regulator n=1 Tax=Streptococcus cuniculi TaxID=1432788 RepID=A0A4Y9JCH0_9STRE|nr:helix-turn-helix transcriptional regulator [Streptococcus cuniculi]MBF0778271.1 helix-turn-helix transcriptional regulator [Streptococcus cuniculi]TFU97766.1 XRE family transcriptional regulator [Streptococcus cuniculi]